MKQVVQYEAIKCRLAEPGESEFHDSRRASIRARMNPERWQRLEEIFHGAREHQTVDRAEYLARVCNGDGELRFQVESLLAHGEALSKLEPEVHPAAPPAIGPGTFVGPYHIEERLDAGGMGVVYRALDSRLGRQVAIKVGFAQFSDRFYREARTIARLNHANVCTLHDIGSTPDVPSYLVMEFVEGPTLANRLASGTMPVEEAVDIGRQIAAALAAAHQRAIVHRDLKPANVKITPQGVVKVLDFGLAKGFPGSPAAPLGTRAPTEAPLLADAALTKAGTVLGTAAYMSPEQAAGMDADARSDIFSFGIVFYEMICGRRPFAGATPSDVIASIVRDEPMPPHRLRDGVPAPLQRILLKCLQKAPAERYASGAELQHDLDALAAPQQSGRFLSLRAALIGAAVLIVLVAGYTGWKSYRRRADMHWLEATAVPGIAHLLQQDRALEALRLYRDAERVAPDSKLLYKLTEGVASHPVKFETTPSGARIYVSDYAAAKSDDLSQWQFVGLSPVTLAEAPNWGYYRLRAVKDGFAPADQVFSDDVAIAVTLHASGTVPQGMVWVPETAATDVLPAVSLPGFWIDRYEVSNRQFQEFVSAGGYQKREYWTQPFVKNGRPISSDEAMSNFHDLTGRPGPANWTLGAYLEGAADLPVAGVSWYEAMAYAAFAGKSIPTVYEWRRAAPIDTNADVVLMSNFSGKALAPIGAHRGMTAFGAYDMAGNVKEWAVNASGLLRYALGGAWDDSTYMYQEDDALDPFWRTVSMGVRTVKRPTPPPAASFAALEHTSGNRPARVAQPVDDQAYRLLVDLHRYQPSALDARVEHTDNSPPLWTHETVSFKAAYANDRVIAHLFLPKNAVPPYQTVIVFGGAGIEKVKRVEDFGFPYEFLMRSGRAVMIPAFWGTLDRGPSLKTLPANEEIDRAIKWSRDLGRSIDYLQTRADIDAARLGFYAISWGAAHTPRLLAVETRLKAAALLSGGFITVQPPEVDSWNFAPRYRVPTLMVNGREDFSFPFETNQKLLFDALGTPAADKRLVLYEGGHRNPVTRPDLLGEILTWFDRYLGPVAAE
jgi:eukaryotic-like serine/threonine-protein kinase